MNKKKQFKGLFCFDGPMYKDKNGLFCSTTLTDEMFLRFFSVVDYLYVAIRCFNSEKTYNELNMKYLDTSRIEIIEVENLTSVRGLLFEKRKFERSIGQLIDRVDMVFARMPSVISDSVLEVATRKSKPYLVEVGGCAWDSYWNHGLSGKIVAPLMFYWEKKYISKADFAIYVTEKFLQHRYPNGNISTNCSNVYLQQVVDSVLSNRINNIRNMDLEHPVFGQTVASIDVAYKGEQYIIKAMKTLKEKGIIAEYQIVGPGDGAFIKAEAKRNGVGDQVILIGAKRKEEVFEWLNEIDIYVQPSKQEGLPRSLIEAMSMGCPAVGSGIAGIPELLDEDCLFNPNNNKQIVEVIINLLNHNNLIEKANNNFKKAKSYELEKIETRRKKIFLEYRNKVESMGANYNG